jgi:Tfp pilus assembly protein PilF
MTSDPQPARVSRRLLLVLALFIVLSVAGYYAWKLSRSDDITAALEANTRGVGYMERFQYMQARQAFEEAQRAAPDWIPAQINLALALLNEAGSITPDGGKESERRNRLFGQSISTYRRILNNNPEKRWQTYARYGLGLIYLTLGDLEKAKPELEQAYLLDPDDAHIVFRYGLSIKDHAPKRAAELLEKAIRLDPYLGSAVYAYFNNPHVKGTEPEKKLEEMSENYLRMNRNGLYNSSEEKYTELGFYGEAIGRTDSPRKAATEPPPPVFLPPENFKVKLAAETRWATAADLGQGDEAALRKAVRERFGGVMVLLDYDRDGKIDVLLLGAVVRKGKLGNLLLRNEGDGQFVDVTEKAGLAGPHASLACSVADFDNDGYPDLFLTGIGEPRLMRNRRDGTFEDVTAKAGLDQLKGVTLASAFVDLDQDGDLDLLVAWWGLTPADALNLLKDPSGKKGGELRVFTNNGMAFPLLTGTDQPALEPKFVLHNAEAFEIKLPVAALGVSDVDLDRDVDVVLLCDGASAEVLLNDRLMRFRRQRFPDALRTAGVSSGIVVLDVDQDERSDLLLIGPKQPPVLLMHEPVIGSPLLENLYRTVNVRGPALLQAQAIDLDLDGLTDVVGLSTERLPALLRNEDRKLVDASTLLGGKENWPADLLAVVAADLDGDGLPDLLGWSEQQGLQLRTQRRNDRRGVFVELTGHRRLDLANGGDITRTNRDGFGTRVAAQIRDHWTCLEYGTLHGGLGQSRLPLTLGLNQHSQAEVLRLRWPDNVWQAEFHFGAGKLHMVEETNRKTTSCPVLFTWNGERFVFITDFLGAGTLGETQPDSTYRMPRPEESVKIEAHQLQPKDGEFILKVAEPMNEVTYLDRLQLLVIDHPAGASVYPDERMATEGAQPSQDLLSFDKAIFAAKATNHHGKDVTAKLKAWDRDMVDEFAWRMWIGFAEDHWIDLDFGDQLKDLGPKDRLFLFAAGSVEYAYPESIWAANQAGVAMQPPVLERKGADGKWTKIAEIGFPAGMPRMMSFDLTGKLNGVTGPLRLRTNLQIFWDQLFLAKVVDRVPPPVKAEEHRLFRATPLEVSSARLYARGFMQEYSPDGKLPTLYDYDRLVPTPASRLTGKLTRFGDVTELLRETDDRFVLIGPGDEAEIRFDARSLPPLPKGWKRSYVLRSWGYCKDTGPFTATGDTIEPLPFRGMTTYPYGPKEKYPDTPKHREYLQRYNTRRVGP